MSPSSQDDDLTLRLVRNIQTGRKVEESARQLHDRFHAKVSLFLRRRGVPPISIDDLTQETFLRVFHGIEGLRMERSESVSAWILEIAANVFHNWLRAVKAKKREGTLIPLTAPLREEGVAVPELTLIDESPDPFAVLAQKGEEAALRAAIAELSEQRRRCCELRYLHGLKYREIAVVMNISIETVKAHLHQARAILEAALKPPGTTPSGGGGGEG
jgi:RNA polymerase sigma factor (sigma-70 family)